MRNLIVLALVCWLCACSTAKPLTPREYLDEQTTATITVVADPLIFVAVGAGAGTWNPEMDLHVDAGGKRDYFEVYGIDVNRMGTHRQYLALMNGFASRQAHDMHSTLVLQMGTQTIELQATNEDVRKLGIVQSIVPASKAASQWWYFPTDAATLKRIASAAELSATLTLQQQATAYTLFSDGRAQLAELTGRLGQE